MTTITVIIWASSAAGIPTGPGKGTRTPTEPRAALPAGSCAATLPLGTAVFAAVLPTTPSSAGAGTPQLGAAAVASGTTAAAFS